ncbi:MAG: IS1 family transposase [Rhodobacter sp.]|nr:IS1 family transposase [Rhodobacter sp.]
MFCLRCEFPIFKLNLLLALAGGGDIPYMNKLDAKTRITILNMLVEGSSMRSISRITGVSINTVTKLLEDAGKACAAFHDTTVVNVSAKDVQCGEIWSFCYSKEKNVASAKAVPEGAGDVWTWTAIDRDSKMILAFEIGDRSAETAREFMFNLASRLANRVQLTTDGHGAYLKAVGDAFAADVECAMLVKLYGEPTGAKGHERKYSPAECTGAKKEPIFGKPDPSRISTSHVERQNLSMRVGMRRFTRLTNGFSKKLENHLHMLSIYFVHYNFVRMHKNLRMTPAMAAGVSDKLHDMAWLVEVIDAAAPAPKPRGPYKKKGL